MRRVTLALLLISTMVLAGCLGTNTAQWGSEGIEVDFSIEETAITTNLGASESTFQSLSPIGCEIGEEVVPGKNASAKIKFTGYLSASVLYESHDPANGAKNMDTAVTAAVAVQAMPIGEARSVKDGEGARIDIKEWNIPLMPETRAGTVDLDEIDSDTDSQWYVLGLIPTTENINDGFLALEEWHKPITIHGYLISPTTVNGSAFTIDGKAQTTGYYRSSGSIAHTLTDNCNLNVGSSNLQSVYVLVDKIEIDGRIVSASGNHGDEWKYGDVPFIGRAGFITFFLLVGVGGSIGMFLLSQMIVRQGARETMKTLLGEEGLAKIKKVATDLRAQKKSGSVTPTERKRQHEREDKAAQKQRAPPKKTSKKDDSGIAGFDLDSALSGGSTDGPTDFGGGSSSVVATKESIKLEKELAKSEVVNSGGFTPQESWSPPPAKRERSPVSNVVSSEGPPKRKEHFSSVRSDPSVRKAAAKAPVKRRAAKKRKAASQPEPEPEYEAKPEQFEEEGDFSDFSL